MDNAFKMYFFDRIGQKTMQENLKIIFFYMIPIIGHKTGIFHAMKVPHKKCKNNVDIKSTLLILIIGQNPLRICTKVTHVGNNFFEWKFAQNILVILSIFFKYFFEFS